MDNKLPKFLPALRELRLPDSSPAITGAMRQSTLRFRMRWSLLWGKEDITTTNITNHTMQHGEGFKYSEDDFATCLVDARSVQCYMYAALPALLRGKVSCHPYYSLT